MSVDDRPIILVEDDQPKLAFLLRTINPITGAATDWLVADRDFRFVIRNPAAALDTDPNIVTYLSTGASPAIVKFAPNRVEVQIGPPATATPAPKSAPYRYYLQAAPIGTTLWTSVRMGNWIVEDF